ncbi:hypothetical protein [Curtobacterium oceanosedimentum]|uniref:Holin n=1 Tax=Curtobacterium oceanosedimentum TaxID=465820 RepID=A0A147DM53_9MICO|nr:hypothetical protein [Curtobacterium oceanosedimentum]KTR47313.1 hypothetical protein NS359_15205 [Curtobacterium oceanosedimentum]
MADGKHEAQGLETQDIWYRAQRVLRTAFTTILTVLPLVPQIVQIVQIIQGQWPTATGLTAVAVQAVAINSALTAIIALPTVNRWLTSVGLGSEPRAVAKERASAKTQELQPASVEPSTVDYRLEQGD